MNKSQMHDFAATKEKGLPISVKAHGRHKAKKAAKMPPSLKYE